MKKLSRTGVFIDAANFEISLKQCGLRANYKKLLKWLSQDGKVTLLRYYGPSFNTEGQNRFFTFLKKRGFKIVTKDIKIIKQHEKQSKHKANFDVEIAVDAFNYINKYDEFILFSGNSDFVYLASKLQERNIKVIVISPHWRTARELRSKADQFMDLRNCEFVEKIKRLPFGSAHDNLSTAKKV